MEDRVSVFHHMSYSRLWDTPHIKIHHLIETSLKCVTSQSRTWEVMQELKTVSVVYKWEKWKIQVCCWNQSFQGREKDISIYYKPPIYVVTYLPITSGFIIWPIVVLSFNHLKYGRTSTHSFQHIIYDWVEFMWVSLNHLGSIPYYNYSFNWINNKIVFNFKTNKSIICEYFLAIICS